MTSRRSFLRGSASITLCGALSSSIPAFAKGLGLPPGLQLYSVRELLPKDYEGTLKMVAAAGYKEVEAAGFYDHSVEDVKRAMNSAGLKCVSSHYGYGGLAPKLDDILAFNKELGVEYIICASPAHRTTGSADTYSLDDWYFTADRLNAFGEKATAAGLRFGYHNHSEEFSKIDGVVPYDELLRRTDPAHVTMEMDCGWVIVGGGSPLEYLKNYPDRFTMLHIKDFIRKGPPSTAPGDYTITELGRGSIDYRPIFAQAAKSAKLRHVFAEQEAFDIPAPESLRVDAEYMKRLMTQSSLPAIARRHSRMAP